MKTYHIDFQTKKLLNTEEITDFPPTDETEPEMLLIELQKFFENSLTYQRSPEGITKVLSIIEKLKPMSGGDFKVKLEMMSNYYRMLGSL